MNENKELVEVKKEDMWQDALENEPWLAPLVDIYETNDNYILTANMPGVSKTNAQISIEEDNLILMGKVDINELSARKYVLKESETGNYYRKFKLTNSIDSEKVDANFDNGVLNIILPKHERAKPKNIEIK